MKTEKNEYEDRGKIVLEDELAAIPGQIENACQVINLRAKRDKFFGEDYQIRSI